MGRRQILWCTGEHDQWLNEVVPSTGDGILELRHFSPSQLFPQPSSPPSQPTSAAVHYYLQWAAQVISYFSGTLTQFPFHHLYHWAQKKRPSQLLPPPNLQVLKVCMRHVKMHNQCNIQGLCVRVCVFHTCIMCWCKFFVFPPCIIQFYLLSGV